MSLGELHRLLPIAALLTTVFIQSATMCPTLCECSTKYYVYCQGQGVSDSQLSDVLSGMSTSAILLDISSNDLTTIPADAFRLFPYLEILNLASNKITEMREDMFHGLINLKELDLHKNQISKLNPNAFSALHNLRDLHLGDNLITNIPVELFANLTFLERLHLQKNLLNDIHPGTFTEMERLQLLNLSRNFIKTITDLTFSGMKTLKRLVLSDNLISEFSVNAFKGLLTLDELQLRDNQISDLIFIYGNDFSGSLTSVNLSGNQITSVPSHVFPHNSNLKQIDLSRNAIRKMGGNAFANLNLESLMLQRNNLTEINRDMFKDAKRVSEINLSHNKISEILPGAFDSVRDNLLVMELRSNQLSQIHPGMFRGMRRLRVLNIAANVISVLDPGCFNDLEKLEELNLSGNKFTVLESSLLSGPTGLRKLYLVCNPLQKMIGFSFDQVNDKIYIESNSTMLTSTSSSAVITWPYREGTQLYWILSISCITSPSCSVPPYEPILKPYVTQVTVTRLTPGTEYFICVSPVFLSGDVNVSQCVHILTPESTDGFRHTTVSADHVRNTGISRTVSCRTFMLLLLLLVHVHTMASS